MNNETVILIEENPACGWCGKELGDEPTLHALECAEQPYAVLIRHLFPALMDEFKVDSIEALPLEVKNGLRTALEATIGHITRRRWIYPENL